MKKLIEKIKTKFSRKPLLVIPDVSVSVASSDVGKCTTCRFNNGKYYNCTVGTYWAEQGLNRICYEGELWEACVFKYKS